MTVQMHVATSDPFGIMGTFPPKMHRAATSTINIDVISERIRTVLRAWDKFSTSAPSRADAASVSFVLIDDSGVAPVAETVAVEPVPVQAAPVRAYPQTAVEAVEYLADLLQVTQDAVLRGTQVNERTYYGWKSRPDAKPRAASLGRLWPTVEALTYLAGAHPNLAAWFHSTPAAQEAFDGGDLNRLLQLEVEWVSAIVATLGLRNATSAAVPAPAFGDIGDRLDDPADHDDMPLSGDAESAAMTSRTNKLSRTALPPAQDSVSD